MFRLTGLMSYKVGSFPASYLELPSCPRYANDIVEPNCGQGGEQALFLEGKVSLSRRKKHSHKLSHFEPSKLLLNFLKVPNFGS